MGTSELIAAAAIVLGFGVTVVMFRVQRELYVREVLKENTVWLAWADYLILASVALAVFGVIVPLLVVPGAPATLRRTCAAFCVAAVVLQAGYVPSILAHYRIEIGAKTEGTRAKGEPAERPLVIASILLAAVGFVVTVWLPVLAR